MTETTNKVLRSPGIEASIRINRVNADKQFSEINKRLEKLDKKLQLMSGFDFVKMNEEVSYLRKRLARMIERETLVTELSFYARHKQDENVSIKMNAAVIWALDQPDEWWDKLNLDIATVKETAFLVMQEYSELRAERIENRKAV